MHVDGAFGAAAVLSDEVRPRLRGMGRASSLAFDFHKLLELPPFASASHRDSPGRGVGFYRWLHVNYDCGCVLVRDGDTHLRAVADLLAVGASGVSSHLWV